MKHKLLKEYFNFSTREKNGVLVLIFMLIVIIGIRIIIHFININNKVDFKEFEQQIDNFSNSEKHINYEQFYFDPNNAEEKDLKRLGFSEKAVKSIINYRIKGGKFYNKEDLKKIYNVTDAEFEFIKDFVIISDFRTKPHKNNYIKELEYQQKNVQNVQSTEKTKYQPSNNKTIILDLNTATVEDLQKLSGIGHVYAKRIIDYKNKLGGYVNIEQVKEIYGFTPELFENIKTQLKIENNKINKININTADFKKLVSHPYIDKENAINILNYRKFAVKIGNFEELLKQKAVNQDFYNKMHHYITTEE